MIMLGIKVGYKYRNLALQVCVCCPLRMWWIPEDSLPLFHDHSRERQQNLIGLQFNFNYVRPSGSICACLPARAPVWSSSRGGEEGRQKSAHILLGNMYWKRQRSMEGRRGCCPLLLNDFHLFVRSDCFMYKSWNKASRPFYEWICINIQVYPDEELWKASVAFHRCLQL